MSSAIIPKSRLLAVHQVCGVIVCKQCRIGLPSERSAKSHLINMHSVDPFAAKERAMKCNNAAESVKAVPHPMREIYFHAPDPVPDSDDHHAFLPPLEGVEISSGYSCTKCNSCYTSEKGIRTHLLTKHSITGDDEWEKIALNGSICVQTIFAGNRTKYFPVSSTDPFGLVLSAGSHTATQNSVPPLQSPGVPQNAPLSPKADPSIQQFFAELDNALKTEQGSQELPSSHTNPYLAATGFHLQLREEGFNKEEAAKYSALLDMANEQETLAIDDVKAYFLKTQQLAKDVAPSVLNDINLIGKKEFNIVSDASAKKYARNFSRLVLCAFRTRQLPFMPPELLKPVNEYFGTLGQKEVRSPPNTRLNKLHELLRALCHFRLSKAESPRRLFMRHFIMFASVVGGARNNQSGCYRWAQAKDITHLLAALLYGASSCAIFEVHRLGLIVAHLRKHPSSKIQTRQRCKKIDGRFESVLLALDESQNSPAAFVRKLLTKARSIASSEEVLFLFDTCDEHHMCGIVDNVHISLRQVGDIVRNTQREIESTFTSLLHGASLPPNFFSHLSALKDSLQESQSGSSFLSQAHARERAKTYAMWLFNTITCDRPTGKTEFTPLNSDISNGNTVTVFGRALKRTAVEEWLRTTQKLQGSLLVCTHLSSGSPGRATELETLKLFNTDYAPRNFYISQGRVVIVTRYSKTRALTGLDKVIPRFPDVATSKLFLTYLLLFRTLESAFVGALYGTPTMKSHIQALFVERGDYYKAARIRDLIRAAFRRHDLPIEFNHYRHYTVGILPMVTEYSPRLQTNELVTDATAIAHLQAGHSAATAEYNYARRPTALPSITSSSLAKYKLFSFEWHKCLGLVDNNSLKSTRSFPSHPAQHSDMPIPTSLSNSITSTISKSIKKEFQVIGTRVASSKRPLHTAPNNTLPKRPCVSSILEPHPFAVEENLSTYLSALRAFMKDRTAMFRSETQLHATVAIAKAQHNVLLIMPTGAGKTISFLLPVSLEGPDSSTVIIVPLAALVNEMVHKCKSLNLSVATWSNRHTLAQVYVISADHTRRDLECFLRALQNNNRLRRVVFDEAHLLLIWADFRSSFQRLPFALQQSGSLQVQFVLCTATLPPVYRQRLLDILLIRSVVLYFQPTIRRNLKYRVIDTSERAGAQDQGRFLTHQQIVLDELCQEMLAICDVLLKAEGGRVLVFCLYKKQVEEARNLLTSFLHNNLGSSVSIRAFYGSMPSKDKNECYEFWKQYDPKPRIVVATSAFGTGLDVPDVRAVYHLGGSNSSLSMYRKQAVLEETENNLFALLSTTSPWPMSTLNVFCHQQPIPHLPVWNTKTKSVRSGSLCSDTCHALLAAEKFFSGMWMESTQDFASWTKMPQTAIFVSPSRNLLLKQSPRMNLPRSPLSYFHHHSSLNTLFQSSFPNPLLYNQKLSLLEQLMMPTPSMTPLQTLITPFYSFQTHRPPIPSRNYTLSSPLPPHTHTPPTNPPMPVARTLQFGSRHPPVEADPLTEFRNAAHSLQNICIPCFVLEKVKKEAKHPCEYKENRCFRCFHLGHTTKDCNTFDPFLKNYCYGCSLSQVRGENVHRPGEFGKSCYMGVARSLVWMLWANGLYADESFRSSLLSSQDSIKLQQLPSNSRNIHEFFVTWLRSRVEGVPNLVRLIFWWLSVHSLN